MSNIQNPNSEQSAGNGTKPTVMRRLKCWLGKHDWVNIDTKHIPKLEPGEMYCYADLHECKHCKKREYKGMGCVFNCAQRSGLCDAAKQRG